MTSIIYVEVCTEKWTMKTNHNYSKSTDFFYAHNIHTHTISDLERRYAPAPFIPPLFLLTVKYIIQWTSIGLCVAFCVLWGYESAIHVCVWGYVFRSQYFSELFSHSSVRPFPLLFGLFICIICFFFGGQMEFKLCSVFFWIRIWMM